MGLGSDHLLVLHAICVTVLCSGITSHKYLPPMVTTFPSGAMLLLNPLPKICTLVPPARDPNRGVVLYIATLCATQV
jgi:hypothetical protein